MGSRKLKISVWILLLVFLGCYYDWFLGLIVEIIGPGVNSVLFQDVGGGSLSSGGLGSKGVKNDGGEGGTGLPAVLFGDIFPSYADEQMNAWSEQVQWQLTMLNTMIGGKDSDEYGGALRSKGLGGVPTKSVAEACQGPKIRCGSPIGCEFGCQIHNMMTCLIISYTTNRTLVSTWKNWPYAESSQKWGSLFQPIGFNCPFDRETGLVIWHKSKIEIVTRDLLEYPFSSGFTIPEEIGNLGKRLGVNIFHWWAGQFAKFALRLHPRQERMISKAKSLIRFSSKEPTVGILVRRRDKFGEKKKTTNSLDKYMTVAKRFIAKFEAKLLSGQSTLTGERVSRVGASTNVSISFKRRIFLATDDKSLLMLARKQYPPPKWEILGFQRNVDSEDLLKDIFLLSECDFVLCSFSSDICRLVSEVMESKKLGGAKRVKSLDHKYFYDIPDLGNKEKFNLL